MFKAIFYIMFFPFYLIFGIMKIILYLFTFLFSSILGGMNK